MRTRRAPSIWSAAGTAARGAALAALLAGAIPLAAAESDEPADFFELEARVTYTISDGVFIEVAPDGPLRQGMTGWLEHRGTRIARIEVGQVASRSAFLRISPDPTIRLPLPGDSVRLYLQGLPAPPPEERPISPTVKEPEVPEPPAFEPLLGPYLVDSETKNLFHGRVGLRQFMQATSNELLDYSRTHLDTSGSLDRIGGTPWALEWSLDTIYRQGEALEDSDHFEEVWPEVYELALARRFDSRSILRFGRFLPTELPSAGYLDGGQGELVLGEFLRVGGMVGFKPERDDLAVSGKEPTVVPYSTFFWDVDRTHHYSATAGLLLSMYEGDFDRFALLVDQRATVDRWSFYSTAELDFDTGSAVATDGARLTRFDFTTTYLWGGTALRAIVNKFAIPDTAAERDMLDLTTVPPEAFLDDSTWRGSLGATHRLSQSLSIEEEVSFIDSGDGEDELLWLFGVTQREWFGRGSSLTVRLYSLAGTELEGIGGSIIAYIPVGGRLALLPSLSARAALFDSPEEDFEVGDAGLRFDWRMSGSWSIAGGVIYTDADDIGRFAFDLGMTLRCR